IVCCFLLFSEYICVSSLSIYLITFFLTGMCPKSISGSILWRNDGRIWSSSTIGFLLNLSLTTFYMTQVSFGYLSIIYCSMLFNCKQGFRPYLGMPRERTALPLDM